MAVAHDASSSGVTSHTTAGASTAITLGSGATALLVEVGGNIAFTGNASLTARNVHVTGTTTPLRLLGYTDNDNVTGYGWTELWGLINPPTGTQTVTVVENDGTTPAYLTVHADSYTGASAFGTPVVYASVGATVTSGRVATNTGNMVVTVQGCYPGYTLTGPSGTSRYSSGATSNYVTLLVQDTPGVSPQVTNTCNYSGGNLFGWGTVSVNLVGGNQYSKNASMAITATTSASGTFGGQLRTKNSSTSITATLSASGAVTHLGAPLRYVGRYPDTDAVVVPVAYANADNASVAVSPTWVTQQVNIAAANCVSQAWVTGQIANYRTQSQITTQLSSYVPKSTLGANSGVAVSNSANQVPSGQLPTLVTNSLAKCYDVYGSQGNILVGSGQTVTSTTQNINEVIIAQISVPDPGYPWYPLPFAYVRAASGGTTTLLTAGTGNFGALAVIVEGNTTNYYGAGLCTDDPNPNYYPLLPYGAPVNTQNVSTGAMTPSTYPPFPSTTTSGQTVFQLCGSNVAGIANSNNYLFTGTNLIYYILVIPAVHQ